MTDPQLERLARFAALVVATGVVVLACYLFYPASWVNPTARFVEGYVDPVVLLKGSAALVLVCLWLLSKGVK